MLHEHYECIIVDSERLVPSLPPQTLFNRNFCKLGELHQCLEDGDIACFKQCEANLGNAKCCFGRFASLDDRRNLGGGCAALVRA